MHGRQPHEIREVKRFEDLEFVKKLRDINGLSSAPPPTLHQRGHQMPKPFVWIAGPKKIIAGVKRGGPSREIDPRVGRFQASISISISKQLTDNRTLIAPGLRRIPMP